MQTEPTPESETRELWYELGRLYSGEAGGKDRARMLAFTVVCAAGALVLLSGYFFGTSWVGATITGAFGAAMIPLLLGLLGGVVAFGRRRIKLRRREKPLKKALSEKDQNPERPARDGLDAYYDVQLVLLRSEYEFLRTRGYKKAAELFEETFGFGPEDPFETGPLNVAPDGEGMQALRERWERKIFMRARHGAESPALGLKEDLAYHVFPREMTVPVELALRGAYLEISCALIRKRYGRKPLQKSGPLPKELRRRVQRDLGEYAAITGKIS